MSQTKIITCTCVHDFQDKQNGKQKRIANYGDKSKKWTCTVCGKKHD